MEGFMNLVKGKWELTMNKCPEAAYSLDKWHGGLGDLRRF
jgi:hypothetical protein